MKRGFTLAAIFVCAALCLTTAVAAQTKEYRGSVGNSHIQMRLTFNGSNVSGTYAYDTIGEDLQLAGRLDADGKLELKEFDARKKQSGKFVCKRRLDDPIDAECSWSRLDGTREAFVHLDEQDVTTALQITPKTIINRKTGVSASYPQILTNAPPSVGAQGFNRRMVALVQKAVSEFDPIDGQGSFEANYNVLLATPDLVSIELNVYYDGGGAHPNNYFWSLTYDLKANQELKFEDLFQPDSDYNPAIAKYIVADIDRRGAAMDQRDASPSQPPAKRDESIVSMDQLTELSGWGMTPKGLVVYFDFPHVIAVFDKNFVPYSVVRQYLKLGGPAARYQ